MERTPQEIAKEVNEKIEAFKAQLDKAITKEQFAELDDKLEAFASKEDVKNILKGEEFQGLKKELETLTESVNQVKDNYTKESIQKSFKEQVIEQMYANKEMLEELKKNPKERLNIAVKVAGNILQSGNLTGRVARVEYDSERYWTVRRRPFLIDFVTVGRTNGKTVYYVEQKNPDGAPAMTAEGAAKPQIDWDYVEASATVEKLAAWVKASKEMLDDVDGFAEDISRELTERIMLLLDAQILTGDGTSNALVGIAENATAFAAGNLANVIVDANNTDCLRAAVAQVQRQLFEPTAIFIHPDDAAEMDLEKGTDGHYTLPPFTSADGMQIKGVPVITNTGVTVDNFYVGDFSKYILKIREDITISVGYDSDDWTKNFVTPLAEMRAVGYIPSNHYGAIVSGTFTVAKALLDPDVSSS